MSDAMVSDDDGPGFLIEPKNKFFEAIRAVAEFELRPGPSVSFMSEVDLTEIEILRTRVPVEQKPSYTAFAVKAVALALREFPYANRRVCRPPFLVWTGARLQKFQRCDVAVASERDVPGAESAAFFDILRDADRRSLVEVTEFLRALAASDVTTNQQWREFSTLVTRLPQRLSTLLIRLPYYFPSLWVKYRGGAILVNSPTKYGIDAVLATHLYPMSLSFGLVKPRPVVREGRIVPCTTFALTLNFDRRVMAGAQAGRFFKRIIDVLEHAEVEMAAYL
jgi:pyruvate/2-oxoglutarate dehydrogenase complex dihydrolipoamide acyltransferase (E2) component